MYTCAISKRRCYLTIFSHLCEYISKNIRRSIVDKNETTVSLIIMRCLIEQQPMPLTFTATSLYACVTYSICMIETSSKELHVCVDV